MSQQTPTEKNLYVKKNSLHSVSFKMVIKLQLKIGSSSTLPLHYRRNLDNLIRLAKSYETCLSISKFLIFYRAWL